MMPADFSDALIVTESPVKAERIRTVCASRGFYPEVAYTGGSVSEARVEFSPSPVFSISPSPGSRVRVMELVKRARGRMVFVATDRDREGELIALSLFHFLKNAAAETVRSDLRSMKSSDCLGVFYRTRSLDMPLAYAALCRAYFDREIGIGLYRASEEVEGGPFSLGRVKAAMLWRLAERPYSYRDAACPPRTGDVLVKAIDSGRSVSETYGRMQSAYEKGLLSYIRTDNGRIPQDVLDKFATTIGWNAATAVEERTDEYSQEAHWCVYPLKYDPEAGPEAPEETPEEKETIGIVEACLKDALAGKDLSFSSGAHTEKSLIRFMQTEGIARPSTYVATLEGMKPYSSNVDGEIKLNERGLRAMNFVSKFPILEYGTSVMEKHLSELASGRTKLSECMKSLTNLVEEITGRAADVERPAEEPGKFVQDPVFYPDYKRGE